MAHLERSRQLSQHGPARPDQESRSACERGAGAVLAFADLAGLRVCGSTTDLRARHYDVGGFAPSCDVLLADDVVLRRRVVDARHGRLMQGATR